MFFKDINTKLKKSALALGSLIAFAGCSLINDDLPECPAALSVRFVYDYNLNFADAFRHAVKSVNVWAFDANGALVWSDSASGDILKEKDFSFETPLGEGTYDFISWCGLEGNDDFDLATYKPASKEELEIKLKTLEEAGKNVSRSMLPSLFHGKMLHQVFTVNPTEPSLKTVTIPLMKDTNNIRVLLQRYNGEPLGEDEFDVEITIANAWLGWDNQLLADNPVVTYSPWGQKLGQVTVNDLQQSGKGIISGIVYELSSSRLIENEKATLTVRRNSDKKSIIEIPIIEYFLMVQGHYENPDGSPLTNQEYLDRQDDYSIVFFIDDSNNWYMAGGIYINSWAVVPPQHENV